MRRPHDRHAAALAPSSRVQSRSEKAWANCRRYEALFGLTPSARRSLRIAERIRSTEPPDYGL